MIKTTTEDGSGILFDQDDSYIYLVTNHHVIEHAQQIQVFTFNNQIVKKGEIVGFDEFYDIAVLRVPLDETISSEIELAFFGNSDYIHLGEMVVAIGNALGHGQSVYSRICQCFKSRSGSKEGKYDSLANRCGN